MIAKSDTWIRGLNQLVSPTQIKRNELAEAVDVQLIEDGKVECPRSGQSYYGASINSRVRGLHYYSKSDGTKELLRSSGTTLKKYVNEVTWSAISGFTYTNDLDTNSVMAYDRLYLCNGIDNLTYYDGSAIISFTPRAAPVISSVTRTGGSTGTHTFSYKITTVTAVGESTPSAANSQVADWTTPSATNYMTLAWSAVTGAVGYNIYGRIDGAWFFMKYVEGNASVSYVDNGVDTPNEAFPPPEGDGTAGPGGKYIAVYKDSLFVLGDPDNPSRLFYSGGGDQINNFSIGGGGGFIDIAKNDGQKGTGLIVFKNSLIVFKDDSTYQFTFTSTGLPQITQVNPSVGCIAPRSICAVENDVFFLSRRGIFTIGNEAGFAFDVLRTNELSSRVRPIVQGIDGAYVQNASALYLTSSDFNVYILSYTPSGSTTNSRCLVYDRERLGWYQWTNMAANSWLTYRGSDGVTHYLYGDDASGYVKEVLSGIDDFGVAIHGYFYLNGEAFKNGIDRYKNLKDIDIVLRRPFGSISLDVVKDGVQTAFSAPIGTISPAINFGHYTFSDFLFGDSDGTGIASADELILRSLKNVNLRDGKTFQLRFDNNSVSRFVLLSAGMAAKPRGERYRLPDDLVQV